MTEQFDSLNAKTKLIDISLKYTDGDIEKAKSMVSGQYDDVISVKGKFNVMSKNLSGMFIVFVNVVDEYISSLTAVAASKDSIFERVRIFDDWKTLFDDINAYKKDDDVVSNGEISDYLMDSVIKYDIFPNVQNKELAELTRKFAEILRDYYEAPDTQCQIDLSSTNSLALELAGIEIEVPVSDEAHEADEGEAKKSIVPEDSRITEIENQAKYIVQGSIIVSPVSGLYINDIEIGEIIKILLTGKDAVTKKLISVLDAEREDGSLGPVKGRLKAKIPMEKSGYILYALVAKGVLAKIVEEENVKIQVDTTIKQEIKNTKTFNRILYILAAIIAMIIIAAVILVQVL